MVPAGLLLGSRYRLDGLIAAGGMGEVWQGTDLVLARRVAVKLLRQEQARGDDGPARFRNEARLAGLLSHPNIAQVFDYSDGADDPDGGRPYLVMELVDGPSLASLLAGGPVGPALAMGVTAQVAAGLGAAHTAGLVHRDIKPGNLLITREGLVKITDFGIAHALDSAPVTQTGVVIGTWAYLAPERMAGAAASPAADLYSLGVVAWECLTGEPPFGGDPLAAALAHQEQRDLPLPPSVPERVAELVADLTARDPGARPASAAEVVTRAEQLRAELASRPATRPGLPVLAGAIVGASGSPEAGSAEQRIPAAGTTRVVTTPPPARAAAPPPDAGGRGPATAGTGGGSGRWLRSSMVAAVIVLAGVAAWAMTSLRTPAPQHARLSARTPAVRHSGRGTPAAPSDLGSAPASQPIPPVSAAPPPASTAPARSARPSPSASHSPAASASPSPSTSPSPAPTTPSPSGSPAPTGTPTATATATAAGATSGPGSPRPSP